MTCSTQPSDASAFLEQDRRLARLELLPVRVALTAEQVIEHDLPAAPPKATHSRTSSWRGETYQFEALPPDVLAGIGRTATASLLDQAVLDHQFALEADDRVELWRGLPRGSE